MRIDTDDDHVLLKALAEFEEQRAELTRVIADLRRKLSKDAVLIPLKAAAADSGFSQEAIRRWATTGLVRAVRVGGRWLVDRHSLDTYLQRRQYAH